MEEAARDYRIEISNLNDKGYEIVIYRQKENVWEELRENIFFLNYKYFVSKCRAEKKIPNVIQKLNIKNKIINKTYFHSGPVMSLK